MKIWSGLWKKIVAVFATITCVASLSSIATSYSITSSVDKNNFDIQTTKRENATVDSTENKVEEKTNTLSESNNENQTKTHTQVITLFILMFLSIEFTSIQLIQV